MGCSSAVAWGGGRNDPTRRYIRNVSLRWEPLLTQDYLPDLQLIQTHLNSLERSYPSVSSIHTVLASRLQSAMQSMHTPPSSGQEFVFPGTHTDYSWTIFDQDIMSLANPSWLFDGSMGQVPNEVDRMQTASRVQSGSSEQYETSMLTGSAQDLVTPRRWGQPADAWSPTIS